MKESEEQSFKITPKGIIAGCLMDNNVENYLEITEKIWEKLYEIGCKEIGETGLPALIITQDGGNFHPAFLDTDRKE